MAQVDHAAKQAVKRFWEDECCGERYGDDQERLRYLFEPEILDLADFDAGTDKAVLEIGIGLGADFVRWASAGRHTVGVDLTERAVSRTRQRLQTGGTSADVCVSDAENLPFRDRYFDVVYSWGVLHHTPDTRRAIDEVKRVLAPGGRLKLMLYHRHSWVAWAAWMRFCLLRGRPYDNLSVAVSHVESPGTKAFTKDEVVDMLVGCVDITVRPTLTVWDRRFAPGLSRLLGNRLGWFLLIEAAKPA